MASIPVQPPTGNPTTMLGTIEEKNATFVVDTSGSMYAFLPAVKEHLLEALLTRAFKEKDAMFNLVTFSSTVTPWAERMVKCIPQTVMAAGDWLRRVECSTGTNSLDALVLAFSDPVCEGVYLITDGLPDQSPDLILREVAKVGLGRPVHCFHLVSGAADPPAHDFLESLAVQTAGTFHIISLTQHGDVERVLAVVQADHAGIRTANPVYTTATTGAAPPSQQVAGGGGISSGILKNMPPGEDTQVPQLVDQGDQLLGRPKEVKICSVSTSVDYDPTADENGRNSGGVASFTRPTKVVQRPAMAWEAYRPPRLVKRLVTHASPLAAEHGLAQGMRVLAKRDRDGYYCPGTLTDEINPQRTVLITFDRDPKGSKLQHLLQETGPYDVIAYNEAMRHTITPGDRVLAPWEPEGYRMSPGTVVEGIEGRSSGCAADSSSLIVSFFNGKTSKVPKRRAVWIPLSLFERIKLEIQMPLTARQFLIKDPSYPSVPASYHPSLKTYAEVEALSSLGNRRDVPVYRYGETGYGMGGTGGYVNRSVMAGDAVNALIPGTDMTRDELHDKVMRQLAENSNYSLPAMTGKMKYRYYSQMDEDTSTKDRIEDNTHPREITKEEDSMEDSGVSLEKPSGEDDERADSGCETDQLVDTGMQTLSLVDTSSMTDSSLLYPSSRREHRELDEPRPDWKYWKQTPQQRSKGKGVGPFRETTLAAPAEVERHHQSRNMEGLADYVGSLAKSTSFDDRDVVKQDKAQREWLYRQPLPPHLSRGPADPRKYETVPVVANYAKFESKEGRNEQQYSQPHPPSRLHRSYHSEAQEVDEHKTQSKRPSTAANPTYFKSQYDESNPAYFAYETTAPPNRSANFERVDREFKSDRAYLEWLASHPAPLHVPTPQGPGRPLSTKVGTRDMIREMRERATLDKKRSERKRQEDRMKGREYDALMLRESKEDRNRKFRADVMQREEQRRSDCERQLKQTEQAKQVISSAIREQQRSREEGGQSKQKSRVESRADKNQKRSELQTERNREIDEARAKRQELQRERNLHRSQQRSATLDETSRQSALRDSQMRRAKVERIEKFQQKEADAQVKKALRIAVHAQKLQEYRSQVLP